MKKLFFFIIFITLALILIAQEITHKTGVVNVEVPVRVYDGKKFIENLTIKDFILYEDGEQQKIDAVYLIKKRTLKRKEIAGKEDLIKKEELEEKFAPEEPRHFFLVFELLDYLPQIKDVVNYFFQNVMQAEDTLQVITPVNNYRMNTESFKNKTREEIADTLLSIIKKDVGLGNSEYRGVIVEMKKIVRAIGIMLSPAGSDVETILDDYASSIYWSGGQTDRTADLPLVISAYEANLNKLEMIRGVNQRQLIDFGTSLKDLEGQKYVFLLYQRELIPQVDPKIMLQYSNLFQDDPGMYMALTNITGLYARASSIDADLVKQTYADPSISAHFMFLTKIAEQTPFIGMQESSSDVFSAFKSLAEATGGTVASSSNPEFLFEQAVEATENYYLLYYTPKDYKADRKFKKITVKVKGKKYRITHRAGYVAEEIDSDQPVERESEPVEKETIKKPLSFIDRGLSQYQSGDLAAAVENFTRAIEIDPKNALAYYNRGIAFEDLGDPYSAVEDYTKAIEINPSNAEAYNNRGCLMVKEGDYEEAIQDFTSAIKIKSDYATAYFNKGNAWMGLGEYSHALKDFKKAIELDPKKKEKASEKIKFCESKIKDK